MNPLSTTAAADTTITGRTLTREPQQELLAAAVGPLRFEACDLEGADLSRPDLREADISGLRLVDARLFRGATISLNQAAELLRDLGITVG